MNMRIDQATADLIQEVANIASGSAATVLDRRLGKRGVQVDIPKVWVGERFATERLPEERGLDLISIQLTLTGQLNGSIYWVMHQRDALTVVATARGLEKRPPGFGDREVRSIVEIAGDMGAAAAGALSSLTMLDVAHARPVFQAGLPTDFGPTESGALASTITAESKLRVKGPTLVSSRWFVRMPEADLQKLIAAFSKILGKPVGRLGAAS